MKLKKTILGLAVVAVAGVNVLNANEEIQRTFDVSLENVEAEACCIVEITSTGYIEWCYCGCNQRCPCADGWGIGRSYYQKA